MKDYPDAISTVVNSKEIESDIWFDQNFNNSKKEIQRRKQILENSFQVKYGTIDEFSKKPGEFFKVSNTHVLICWQDVKLGHAGQIAYELPQKVVDWIGSSETIKPLRFVAYFVATSAFLASKRQARELTDRKRALRK